MTQITLKNLHLFSAQEVADQITNHLLTQMKVSYKNNSKNDCAYKIIDENGNTLKCAAGCLIADDEYQTDFEGNSWYSIIEYFNISSNHQDLIRDFQTIHDSEEPSNWKKSIKNVYDRESLIWSFS
jgi:hypothetical protein